MNNPEMQTDIRRDQMRTDDWTDREDDTLPMDSSLEFERWKWAPDAKVKWDDLGKDAAAANLDKNEMLSIKINETFIYNLEMLRSANSPKEIGEYFFDESLLTAAHRRNASTEVLSLGKEGFLRKISATRISQKGYYQEGGENPLMAQEKPEQKNKWLLWKKGGNSK